MSAQDAARTTGHGDAAHQPSPTRLICLLGATLALGYLAALITAWLGGHFLLDGDGQPIANDFVNVWAAGRLALDGNPAAAYDWTLHKAAEVGAVGHDFRTITAGTIRRHSCSLPRRSRHCRILSRRWSG